MSAIQMLLMELDHEARATRRVLERVPGDRLNYRPHEKSMSLGQLALHVAIVPGAIAQLSRKSPVQVPEFKLPSPQTADELVPALDHSLAQAHEVLGAMDDASLGEQWRLVDGDREVMSQPVGIMLRALMLNHWYHHRGQLCVYLREVGVPVPSVYGPSADENPFASPREVAIAAG
jgi:uncharacterized damage-inducible protein DinB